MKLLWITDRILLLTLGPSLRFCILSTSTNYAVYVWFR